MREISATVANANTYGCPVHVRGCSPHARSQADGPPKIHTEKKLPLPGSDRECPAVSASIHLGHRQKSARWSSDRESLARSTAPAAWNFLPMLLFRQELTEPPQH